MDSNPAPPSTSSNGQSKIANDDDQHTCDLQPISGNVLYCCKELMSFTSVYKRMHDLVVRAYTCMHSQGIILTLTLSSFVNVVHILIRRFFCDPPLEHSLLLSLPHSLPTSLAYSPIPPYLPSFRVSDRHLFSLTQKYYDLCLSITYYIFLRVCCSFTPSYSNPFHSTDITLNHYTPSRLPIFFIYYCIFLQFYMIRWR